jgi:MFS transporter, DHA1 family, inner membrane transport protein
LRDLKSLVPAIVLGVMGNSVIYLIPLLIGGMVGDRGFTEQQSGWLASIDLGGYALATALTALVVDRLSWRYLALFGVAIIALANVATTFAHPFSTFAGVRFVSGIGCGILAALASITLSRTADPERSFGVLFAVSLLFGTAGLWGLPSLLELYGLNGAYWLLAGLAVLVGIVAARLPDRIAPAPAAVAGGGASPILVALVLVSVLLFWAEQNAVYAYVERIGNAAGLEPQFIGFALGLANLTGFAGAALVAWLGSRAGRLLPLAVVTVLQLVCLATLSGQVTSVAYLLGLGLLSMAWNVVNPFQLGVLAGVDSTGKSLALAATVTGVGLAAGPAAGAAAIAYGGYGAILSMAGALAVLSLVLLLPPLAGIARHARAR